MAHNLLNLNDDCLLEIFKYLPIPELADVASTCTRFRTIARDAFSRYQKSEWVIIDVGGHQLRNYEDRVRTTAIIRHFGDMTTQLAIHFWNDQQRKLYNNAALNLMAKYCTGPLETMVMRHCAFLHQEVAADARSLFQNVKQIIWRGSSALVAFFLSEAKQLKRLELEFFESADVITFLTDPGVYPKLQSLALSSTSDGGEINVTDFLKRHPNIIDLNLNGDGEFDLSSIGECRWLRKLSILESQRNEIMPIAQLDKLITLELSSQDLRDLIPFLKASRSSQSLEKLVLDTFLIYLRVNGDEFAAGLAKFVNLKRLVFSIQGNIDDNLLAGVHQLEKLRYLSIGGTFNSFTSSGLLNLVHRLPDLGHLILRPIHSSARLRLKPATYFQIGEICQKRKQKLVIFNCQTFVVKDANINSEQKELFDEGKAHEFVKIFNVLEKFNFVEPTIVEV